jgi:carbonic anhydrase
MTESDGFAKLIEGYRHFREEIYPDHRELFDDLKSQQSPQVLFITCADSRIDPSLITQTDPGDLFICRNIGNIVPAYGEMLGGVSAVVEYAVMALHVRDIIVCGHSDCGAMKALQQPDDPALDAMPTVKIWLRNAHAALSVAKAKHGQLPADQMIGALVQENVVLQIQHLRTHPAVAAGLASGTVRLHGWIYNIGAGSLSTLEEAGTAWRSLLAGSGEVLSAGMR